jgi:flagellar L-ring protein precursor FlgH
MKMNYKGQLRASTTLPALALGLLAAALLAGCSQHRDLDFSSNSPRYIVPPQRISGSTASENGSLWTDGSRVGQVYDFRARDINDLVTIRIVESTIATNTAKVSTERDDSGKRGLTSLLGLQDRLLPHSVTDSASAIDASTKEQFDSTGSNTRSETITSTLTARVVDRLPNGNLVIQANREVIVNHERQNMVLIGTIRPVDIDEANSVASTKIADLQIRYSGSGVLTENTRRGWFSRFINYVWPF